MKIIDFVRDKAGKIKEFVSKKHEFHTYKYCTSINISKNVSDVIRNRRINDIQEKIELLEKIY